MADQKGLPGPASRFVPSTLSEGSMARLYPERDTDLVAELNSGD